MLGLEDYVAWEMLKNLQSSTEKIDIERSWPQCVYDIG